LTEVELYYDNLALARKRELKLEAEIAAGDGATTETMAKLGQPIALTCHDCGGVLSEVACSLPLRFRCQAGTLRQDAAGGASKLC